MNNGICISTHVVGATTRVAPTVIVLSTMCCPIYLLLNSIWADQADTSA